MPFDYAEELLSNPDNFELEIVRRQPSRSATREKHPNTSSELPSNNIVTQRKFAVNSRSIRKIVLSEVEHDQSGSTEDISGRYEDGIGVRRLFPSNEDGGAVLFSQDRTDSEGETGDMGRGVPTATSSGERGAGSDLKFSVATESDTDTDTHSKDFTNEFNGIMQSFQNGEISQDEYMRRVSELYQQSIDENGQIPQGEMVTPQNKPFAAYPELKNIKLSFKQRAKGKNGSYNHSNNEIILNTLLRNDIDKLKKTLVHEMQHAIQHIEGFATGGNKQIGLVYALNRAYDKVGKTEVFKRLPTKEEKLNYLINIAKKEFNATNYKDLGNKAYQAIYGEVEARESGRKRNFDEDMLRISPPDDNGNVIDLDIEKDKFIENFQNMGYTEEEMENIIGGIKYDESRSNDVNAERFERELAHLRPHRDIVRNSDARNNQPNGTGRKESDDMGRGVRAGVPDRRERGAGSDLKFSVATESDTDTDTHSKDFTNEFNGIMQSFQNGEISQDEYMRRVSELYQQSIDENGQIPQGEMVTPQNKPFAVPKSVKDGTEVRQHVSRILESGRATEEQENFLKEMVLTGDFSYAPTSNEANIRNAEKAIEQEGYEKARENWSKNNYIMTEKMSMV